MNFLKQLFLKILCSFLILTSLAAILLYITPFPGTIPVLMYHFVAPETVETTDGNVLRRDAFAMQMAFLKRFHYRVISMDEYYDIQSGDKKSEGREVVISFDDGDFSFEKYALPILKEYQFPVTVFLISSHAAQGIKGSMDLPTIKKIQEEFPWVNFQGHSRTHAHFKEITDSKLKEEIFVSKRELEQMLGRPVHYLTYPFGEFDARSLEAAQRAGYRMAFTTGHKKLGSTPEGNYAKTRVKISNSSRNPFMFWVYLSGFYQTFKGIRQQTKNPGPY